MNNTTKLSNNNNPTNEITYPHVIFSFERKDYTFAELLTVFSANFFDLICLHNFILPDSPCAAIRVNVLTLNLLIIVISTSTDYKIYYCDNCPTLGHRLSSKVRPLFNNQTLTQVLPPSQNSLVAHTAKQQSTPKKSSFKLFNKKPQIQEAEEHPYSVITTAPSTDRPRPTGHSPPIYPTIGNPISPIKDKRKYTQAQH